MIDLSAVIVQQPGVRYPDLKPFDFCLWHYLKNFVYNDTIINVTESNERIIKHIHNVIPKTLQSVVKYAVYQFQLVADNNKQHMKFVCRMSSDI